MVGPLLKGYAAAANTASFYSSTSSWAWQCSLSLLQSSFTTLFGHYSWWVYPLTRPSKPTDQHSHLWTMDTLFTTSSHPAFGPFEFRSSSLCSVPLLLGPS